MEGVSTDLERSSEVVFHVVFSLLYISPVLSHPLAHHTTTERDTYCDLCHSIPLSNSVWTLAGYSMSDAGIILLPLQSSTVGTG